MFGTHAGAEAEGTDIVGCGGIALLHGELHVFNARTVVGKNHPDCIFGNLHVDFAAAGVNDHVDFAFIHRHGNVAGGGRGDTELLERALHIARRGAARVKSVAETS
jgi:hypothetical protein